MITKNKDKKIGRFGFLSKLIVSSILLMTSLSVFSKDFPIDKSSSTLEWEAKKVTGQHNGTISFSEGSLSVEKMKITGGKFTVDMTTIVNTDAGGLNEKLIGHLKSEDFFSVEKFPQSMLVVTKAEKKAGNTYHFTADLTIKGITKPVEFDSEVRVDSGLLIATGVMTVNRAKYDIKFRSASFFSDLGDKMIYDDFSLKFKLVAAIK